LEAGGALQGERKKKTGKKGKREGRTSVSILDLRTSTAKKRAESEVFAPFAFYRATSGGCGGSHGK